MGDPDKLDTICYIATHNESKKAYVGITSRSLKARKLEHESKARAENPKTPFHRALKKYGKDTFRWEVVASGIRPVMQALEHLLIDKLESAELGGLNAIGGLIIPPTSDTNFKREFEEHQRDIAEIYMFYNLEEIVRYCEGHDLAKSEMWDDIAKLGKRLIDRAEQRKAKIAENIIGDVNKENI